MTQHDPNRRIAVVSSPSTNDMVSVSLTAHGRHLPLVGSLIALENPMGEGSELAIGTVTEILTENRWYKDSSLRAAVIDDPANDGFSGDQGDLRTANVALQAAWTRPDTTSGWRPSGSSLRMSPATGTAVHQVDGDVIAALTAASKDLHYMGTLAGADRVPMPLSIPDFATRSGAWHGAVYGRSGSGKTALTCYLLANQLRHRDHGIIIVDPQGQWASEKELPFSLQGFADELGRPVRVRRISEHLRLAPNAELLATLLGKTRFLNEITKMSDETRVLVLDEITKIVRDTDDWENQTSAELMTAVLTALVDPNSKYLSRIYADETRQDRLRDAIHDILDAPKRYAEVARYFTPIHNLFQSTNPLGGTRHSLWHEITAVFDKKDGTASPLLILDMSSKSAPGMNDEAAMAAADLYDVLENDAVKAAVLRNLFSTLKRAAEDRFRDGHNLNTMVVLDEAWRYAPNPQGTEEPEIAALTRDLAGYARDTRKFGIGWLYISQSTNSVNQAIWDQMTIRIFGFGLSGQDMAKMGEVVSDPRSDLRLYRRFADPRATGVYPFFLTGSVSPLSANGTPLVLHAYTSFQDFRDDNVSWIAEHRNLIGRPLASGDPVAPKGSAAAPLPRAPKAVKNPVQAIVETNQAVMTNLASTGTRDAAGFANPLADLDDDAPVPF